METMAGRLVRDLGVGVLALALGVVVATGVHTLRGDAPSTMDYVSEKFLVQQFAREGYILEAVKEVPRYDGECEGRENRVIQDSRLHPKAFIFCRSAEAPER